MASLFVNNALGDGVNTLVIPQHIDSNFFAEKIANAAPGVWVDICGGALPARATNIIYNEIIPVIPAARSGSAATFVDASVRAMVLSLSKYDQAKTIEPDQAGQDIGGAIERDMLVQADYANAYGDGLLSTVLAANTLKGIDGAVLFGNHGTQNNTSTTGKKTSECTRAIADAAAISAIHKLQTFVDDATNSTRFLNRQAKKFLICTGSGTRYDYYAQAKVDHTGNSTLPGFCVDNYVGIALLPQMSTSLVDYVFVLDREPAYLSPVYVPGNSIFAGLDPYLNVFRYRHSFWQTVVPFRWQSAVSITWTAEA